jgi:predicted GIY-YIG superfamily endonuclease
MGRTQVQGTVYLLHFERPYRHAKHYTGWTEHLEERLEAHAAGHSARLIEVIHAAGIGFTLARTWPGTRARERQIKRTGGAARHCPICHPYKKALPGPTPAAPTSHTEARACTQ